jgi:hypothetical protein
MNNIVRKTGKPFECSRMVEVCNDWYDAQSTQQLMMLFGS